MRERCCGMRRRGKSHLLPAARPVLNGVSCLELHLLATVAQGSASAFSLQICLTYALHANAGIRVAVMPSFTGNGFCDRRIDPAHLARRLAALLRGALLLREVAIVAVFAEAVALLGGGFGTEALVGGLLAEA